MIARGAGFDHRFVLEHVITSEVASLSLRRSTEIYGRSSVLVLGMVNAMESGNVSWSNSLKTRRSSPAKRSLLKRRSDTGDVGQSPSYFGVANPPSESV